MLVATRWILARLRHERFFSLAALNARIAELLESLNTRPMRLYRASRRELFERLDRPALRPLPTEAFIVGEWHYDARVNIDYHVELHGHYYSVPHPLTHELVDARLTVATVELFHRGQRVATHVRSHLRGRHTTDPAHMPKAHQLHLEWTPSRFITWARTIGPQTAALVEAILADRPHPEQGYRSCLGILRLAKRDGDTRLEAACARAVAVGARLPPQSFSGHLIGGDDAPLWRWTWGDASAVGSPLRAWLRRRMGCASLGGSRRGGRRRRFSACCGGSRSTAWRASSA